jgi:hypothetical protein
MAVCSTTIVGNIAVFYVRMVPETKQIPLAEINPQEIFAMCELPQSLCRFGKIRPCASVAEYDSGANDSCQ